MPDCNCTYPPLLRFIGTSVSDEYRTQFILQQRLHGLWSLWGGSVPEHFAVNYSPFGLPYRGLLKHQKHPMRLASNKGSQPSKFTHPAATTNL